MERTRNTERDVDKGRDEGRKSVMEWWKKKDLSLFSKRVHSQPQFVSCNNWLRGESCAALRGSFDL